MSGFQKGGFLVQINLFGLLGIVFPKPGNTFNILNPGNSETR